MIDEDHRMNKSKHSTTEAVIKVFIYYLKKQGINFDELQREATATTKKKEKSVISWSQVEK
jgi:DNA-binding transcriptional regulator YhcF (GntR family)